MSHDQPKGENQKAAIAPMLSVRNGVRAIEFYKAAFGAIELYRIDNDAGQVVARLSAAGAEFWLADESPEYFNFSPESLGGGSVRMVMIVEDPDAAFERAVAAGATVVWPVSNQDYWSKKLARNVERDCSACSQLESLGWQCRVIWECELDNGISDILAELKDLAKAT